MILRRLARRTLRRLITREELWNSNRETWRNTFLSRDSLFLWALTTHRRRRRDYPRLLAQPQYRHLVAVQLASPRVTYQWLATLSNADSVS